MTVIAPRTATQYRHRPAPIAALNALGRTSEGVGVAQTLDPDTMIRAARDRTGLRDFGDDWFIEPLTVLVDSINEEAELTPVGRFIQRQRIIGALGNRLRVEDLLRRHPEIHELNLGKIILIAGMQRTGTTVLHRLIASNPEVRSVKAWEALYPVPLPGEGREGGHRRIRRARLAERVLAYLAPTLFAIHPIEHDAPEEDILLLDMSFMSQTFEATMRVPTYSRWLERQDLTKSYEYLRTLLKILAWQRACDVWVLKTPQHLGTLDVVLKVLPETTVVQTHRDPVTALASFCSMVAYSRGMFSDSVDPMEISAHWFRQVHRMVGLAMRVREAADSRRFIDVSYYDLVREPIAALGEIYGQCDLPFGPETVSAAECANQRNRQHRYGRHSYDPGGFGFPGGHADQCFAAYRAEFGIPSESAVVEG